MSHELNFYQSAAHYIASHSGEKIIQGDDMRKNTPVFITNQTVRSDQRLIDRRLARNILSEQILPMHQLHVILFVNSKFLAVKLDLACIDHMVIPNNQQVDLSAFRIIFFFGPCGLG